MSRCLTSLARCTRVSGSLGLCTRPPTLTGSVSTMVQHALHSLALCVTLAVFQLFGGGIGSQLISSQENVDIDPWQKYGTIFAVFLYISRYLVLLALPQALFNFLGLVLFNAFPRRPLLKEDINSWVPLICFRTVTRGNYPNLIRTNVERNINTCLDLGLSDFVFEVVTDKSVDLKLTNRLIETVVPETYETQSGALFKARALQYALEANVISLKDTDWIVHLDEETLLTRNSLIGIINFVRDGRNQFGQGLITYASQEIVSLFFTLTDSFRVGEDMGKIRFQLNAFHKVLLGWKGSYVVSQFDAERKVSFDNGPDSSVAEDTFFGILASSRGYHCGFVEGEMWEKSPFTLMDFLQQRKRWIQGLLLVAHARLIPLKYKILFGMSVYSWVTLPLSTLNLIWSVACPLPIPPIIDVIVSFVGGVTLYLSLYGVWVSFTVKRTGWVRMAAYLLMSILIVPFRVVVENVAVLWGLLTPKHQFYVVKKESPLAILNV